MIVHGQAFVGRLVCDDRGIWQRIALLIKDCQCDLFEWQDQRGFVLLVSYDW